MAAVLEQSRHPASSAAARQLPVRSYASRMSMISLLVFTGGSLINPPFGLITGEISGHQRGDPWPPTGR